MMSDKRSVTTDALEVLGTIIDSTVGRDAIHLAVEPVIAMENLSPGQDVGLVEGGAGTSPNPVGIVDPFLKKKVRKGERFLLLVYPRQITSLRHVWSHPAFPDADTPKTDTDANKAASEAWLRNFCDNSDCPSYESMLEIVTTPEGVQLGDDEDYGKSYIDGDYIHISGYDAHGTIPDEFWDHVEVVTGQRVRHRASYFSCSC
jgi:hypothetical protein